MTEIIARNETSQFLFHLDVRTHRSSIPSLLVSHASGSPKVHSTSSATDVTLRAYVVPHLGGLRRALGSWNIPRALGETLQWRRSRSMPDTGEQSPQAELCSHVTTLTLAWGEGQAPRTTVAKATRDHVRANSHILSTKACVLLIRADEVKPLLSMVFGFANSLRSLVLDRLSEVS